MGRANNIAIVEQSYDVKWVDYLLVFILLFISGNPIVSHITEWAFIYVGIALFVYAWATNIAIASRRLIFVLLSMIAVNILQVYTLSRVSFNANVNYLFKIYCGFIVVSILGEKFRLVYLKVMCVLCIISIAGFLTNLLMGDFPGYQFDRYCSLVLYNYILGGTESHFMDIGIRNSGMFWEPGAFQGYINMAILLYIDEFNVFFQEYKRHFVVLLMALLSTFSTTGYLVLFAIITFAVIKNIKNRLAKVFITAFVAVISFWVYDNLEFMGEKISHEYESVQDMDNNAGASSSRMGSAIVNWENLMRNPVCGNGHLMELRFYGMDFSNFHGGGNGFFGAMNMFGIPMMMLYLLLLYKSYPVVTFFKMTFVIIVVLMLQGEYFLNFPLFWSILFIKYPEKLEYETNSDFDDSV